MSKISQLHAELSEQAYELGYESLEQAFDNGWEVDYEKQVLVKKVDMLEQAHQDWLKEREEVIKSLDHLMLGYVEMGYDEQAGVLQHAIEFIKGCNL